MSLAGQFRLLALPYWNGDNRWVVRGAVAMLVLLTMAQVGLAIWVSYWHRELFDALEARSISDLMRQIITFVVIFVLTMVVTALHMYVKRWVQLDWRRWLSGELLDRWMANTHEYRLHFATGDHDNPDGRIAEDIRIATEMAIGLVHSLLFSVLIVGTFVDILLETSGSLQVPGTTITIPGYMVWMAFLYAGAGTVLGLMLGRPLIRTTNRLQAVEASFRFGLARAREHSEAIALMHGEAHERREASRLFADVGRGWNLQTLAYLGIVSFSTGYGTLLPVFPILVAAPQYIAGVMSLGVLMQAAQAFQRLTAALSWPVDNLGDLARCRASLDRIVALYQDMLELERHRHENDGSGERIRLVHSDRPELDIRNLRLTTAAGQVVLEDFNLHVRRGERILITGDPGVGVSLFKAVAGLWPWGRGEICLPEGRDMMFLPQHPFLPEGSLRAALSYPQDEDHYSDAALHRALECAGLAWLSPRMDEAEDWGRSLPLRARQRLGVARVVLQQPRWVFIEEATDAIELKDEICMMEMLHHELPSTTLLNISLHNGLFHFYDRKLVLRRLHEVRTRPAVEAKPGEPALPEV